jgi:hypothetical protein
MRILFSFLEMVFWFLFEVVLAGLRGELDGDDEGEGRVEPAAYTPEEALELADCKTCGKPNPVEYVFCKSCGELL